jgi:hypothetical protein
MEKMGVEKYILNYEAIKNAKTVSMENLPIDNAWKKMHQWLLMAWVCWLNKQLAHLNSGRANSLRLKQ